MHQYLIIANTNIEQDAQGRYCLNDLHRAAGGDNKKRPSLWTENPQTLALVDELESEAGFPALDIQHGGKTPGTFVRKEMVYAYAMWISAKFHLQVIRAYDELTKPAAHVVPQSLSAALRLAADQADQIEFQQAQLAIAAPKVAALDRIAGAAGSFTIREAAKDLQVKPLEFSNWLKGHDWIFRQGKVNLAYQPRIDAGLMFHKITMLEIEGDDGVTFEKSVTQARITAKGLAKLAVVFSGVAA